MSGSIDTFSIQYEPVNERNTFTSGDTLHGRIVLGVSKEVKIDKLYIKCKGDANVHWTEWNSGTNSNDSYSAHERFFKLKQIFIWDNSKKGKNGAIMVNGEIYRNIVVPGHHTFPFSFQLPHRMMPSSFKGCHGSITYVLQARLSRSWKVTQNAMKEFTVVSKGHANDAYLRRPLSGSVEKKMKLFTSGTVSVRASTDKKGYMQGERIKVKSDIENSSSRALKLKFKLEQKQTFIAQNYSSKQNHTTKVIFKAEEDPIPSRARKTFTSRLTIPSNLDPTITDCNIIKVEYMLKVYLDVPYARDPEIIFPLIIIPAGMYSIPQQNQEYSHTNQNTPEPLLVILPDVPAATPFRPTPTLFPSTYTQPGNPEEPPPSYTDIYPDSASGFNPTLLSFSPPPYSNLDSSPASHHQTAEFLTPESAGAAGYWQRADVYPSK